MSKQKCKSFQVTVMAASQSLIMGLLISMGTSSYAQNVQRLEEEVIKDKEKEVRMYDEMLRRKLEADRLLNEPLTEQDISEKNLVEVEFNNVLPSDIANVYSLVPYKVRRNKWGHYFSLAYSLYNPVNYQSDFVAPSLGDFDQLYGSAQTPFLELSYSYKWNMLLGSLAAEIGYAMYGNDATDPTLGDAQLSLKMVRLGARYNLDNVLYEPRLVPYALGGVYTALFEETQANVTFDGSTGVAAYYGAGLLLQLNWFDSVAAVDAYTESGIENTYLFAEARSYMASNVDEDPDFSSDMDLNFGITIEF